MVRVFHHFALALRPGFSYPRGSLAAEGALMTRFHLLALLLRSLLLATLAMAAVGPTVDGIDDGGRERRRQAEGKRQLQRSVLEVARGECRPAVRKGLVAAGELLPDGRGPAGVLLPPSAPVRGGAGERSTPPRAGSPRA